MFSPVRYAECWCCGQEVLLNVGGTTYYCNPCEVTGSILPGSVSSAFAAESRFIQGAEGMMTAEPYIDHGETHVPSPA
jgi:hypothetical protein